MLGTGEETCYRNGEQEASKRRRHSLSKVILVNCLP